jgi:hypothetical protein
MSWSAALNRIRLRKLQAAVFDVRFVRLRTSVLITLAVRLLQVP